MKRPVAVGVALLAIVLLAGAWALNASRPGTRIRGCSQGCAAERERHPGPMRILSLNMLHGFPRFEHLIDRLDLIALEIRRHDADIVLLQEVPWTLRLGNGARYLGQKTGMNHLYLRANGNRWTILFEEGEAILSRYPLSDLVLVELNPRAGYFEHRVALRATARTPQGDLHLVVTHLTHGDEKINEGQTASLARWVTTLGEGPAIVAGDFNAREDSPQIQSLPGNWVDAHLVASPEGGQATCCVDDPSASQEAILTKRIDYLFVIPGTDASAPMPTGAQRVFDESFRVGDGWLYASDHAGLLVEIDFGP